MCDLEAEKYSLQKVVKFKNINISYHVYFLHREGVVFKKISVKYRSVLLKYMYIHFYMHYTSHL